MPTTYIHRHAYDAQRSNLSKEEARAWIRLFLAMALPVLYLLVGISLTR
jgi:hypothetical protein